MMCIDIYIYIKTQGNTPFLASSARPNLSNLKQIYKWMKKVPPREQNFIMWIPFHWYPQGKLGHSQSDPWPRYLGPSQSPATPKTTENSTLILSTLLSAITAPFVYSNAPFSAKVSSYAQALAKLLRVGWKTGLLKILETSSRQTGMSRYWKLSRDKQRQPLAIYF